MPYNTRRKSLSLPSLGIHVPVTLAERDAARAAAIARRHSRSPSDSASLPTSALATPASFSPRTPNSPADAIDAQTSNPKKIKRSHAHASHDAPAAKRRQTDANVPPLSPPRSRASSVEMKDADDETSSKIDLASINDEIVEAVIVQLQATDNRPHIVKELAAVLMQQLRIVQQSANPCAIISSRLSTYLKRSCWNANNPCPLAKELETVHPRRTYFYLTTCPHGPLPDPTMSALAAAHARTLVTPSATSVSEDADEERRRELSPSPEVDLSSPEFDDMEDDMPMPLTPVGSFSGRHPIAAQHQRGASPPLEKDEKEFTQTADGLQKRKLNGELLNAHKADAADQGMELDEHKDETLFAEPKITSSHTPSMAFVASPAMRPSLSLNLKRESEIISWAKYDSLLEWDRSPETVELDELDGLLNDY